MERLLGLQDFGILPLIGAGVLIYLLVTAFIGGKKGGNGGNNSSNSTPPSNE